ncbi:MAG TPA: hypothetical protein VK162_00750 [Streptosporangiaceae bacterium]|nr:hypothetical protein [Streptosporangiaceae bacterium]
MITERLSLHLAPSPEELIAWADGADRVLDSRNTVEAAGARLEEAFRAALEPVRALGTHLARTIETLGASRSVVATAGGASGHLHRIEAVSQAIKKRLKQETETVVASGHGARLR